MSTFADFYEGDGPVDARAYRGDHRELVVLKAGEWRRDHAFVERWRAFGQTWRFGWARRRCRRSAYFFAHPGQTQPHQAALWFLAWVRQAGGLRPGFDVALCLDLENQEGLDGAQLLWWIDSFGTTVHSFTGRGVILYMPGWMLELLPRAPRYAGVVWVPGYPYLPRLPGWARLFAHQYTDRAQIPGCAGPCDLSQLHADPAAYTVTKGDR